jgi:hypothetical protein
MKKGVSISLVISVMFLVVLIPIVNAGMFDWFKNFFNGNSLEGELRSGGGACTIDSDCGTGGCCASIDVNDPSTNYCTPCPTVSGCMTHDDCFSGDIADDCCQSPSCTEEGTGNGVCYCEFTISGGNCPDGCTLDSDCEDGDSCTNDICNNGVCENTLDTSISGCQCTSPSDCDDGDSCTSEICWGGTCANQPIPGCGTGCTPPDCNDNDACTNDLCVNGNCENTQMNCDDGLICTTDSCSNGVCSNIYMTGCVSTCFTLDCNDNNDCTTDSCSNGACVNEDITCEDDGNDCTDDVCVDGNCENIEVDCSECEDEDEIDELLEDSDNDGISDSEDPDDDNDGILDSEDPDNKNLFISRELQKCITELGEEFETCVKNSPEELCQRQKEVDFEKCSLNEPAPSKEEPIVDQGFFGNLLRGISNFFGIQTGPVQVSVISGVSGGTINAICSTLCCANDYEECEKDENNQCLSCEDDPEIPIYMESCGPLNGGVCCQNYPPTSAEMCVRSSEEGVGWTWECVRPETDECDLGQFRCGDYGYPNPNEGQPFCCDNLAHNSCVEGIECCTPDQTPGPLGCIDGCPTGTTECSYQGETSCCYPDENCVIEEVHVSGGNYDYIPSCQILDDCDEGKQECYRDRSSGQKLCCAPEDSCLVDLGEGLFTCCPPDNPPFGNPPTGCGMDNCEFPCGPLDSGVCCEPEGPNPTICTYDSTEDEYSCKEDDEEECPGEQNLCGKWADGSSLCCNPDQSCWNIDSNDPNLNPLGICCDAGQYPNNGVCGSCPEGTYDCAGTCCSTDNGYACVHDKILNNPNDPPICQQVNEILTEEECSVDGEVPEGVFYCGDDTGDNYECCNFNQEENDQCTFTTDLIPGTTIYAEADYSCR